MYYPLGQRKLTCVNGPKGDPRMTEAVNALMSNPLTHLEALIEGGFGYPADSRETTIDEDGRMLVSQTRLLCRRLETIEAKRLKPLEDDNEEASKLKRTLIARQENPTISNKAALELGGFVFDGSMDAKKRNQLIGYVSRNIFGKENCTQRKYISTQQHRLNNKLAERGLPLLEGAWSVEERDLFTKTMNYSEGERTSAVAIATTTILLH